MYEVNKENEAVNNLANKVCENLGLNTWDHRRIAYETISNYLVIMSQDSAISGDLIRHEQDLYRTASIYNKRDRIKNFTEKFLEVQNPFVIETEWEDKYDFITRSSIIVLKTDDLV